MATAADQAPRNASFPHYTIFLTANRQQRVPASLGALGAPHVIPLHLFLCFSSLQVIAAGTGKLASVPSGGAVASAGAPAAGGAAAAAEEKKEEKVEEEEDEVGGWEKLWSGGGIWGGGEVGSVVRSLRQPGGAMGASSGRRKRQALQRAVVGRVLGWGMCDAGAGLRYGSGALPWWACKRLHARSVHSATSCTISPTPVCAPFLSPVQDMGFSLFD